MNCHRRELGIRDIKIGRLLGEIKQNDWAYVRYEYTEQTDMKIQRAQITAVGAVRRRYD